MPQSTASGRRLPVYVIVDAVLFGRSCRGASVLETLVRIEGDLAKLDSVVVRVIAYGAGAWFLGEKSDVPSTGGTTANLGVAVRLLNQSLPADTRRRTATDAGDFQPVVFLLADRTPDDEDWLRMSLAVRTLVDLRLLNVIGLAFNRDAARPLLRFTPTVFGVRATPDARGAALEWIRSTSEASARLAPRASQRRKVVRLPAVPSGLARLGP